MLNIYLCKGMFHYNDVIMGMMAYQITSLTIIYSTVYWDADQRKHQSSLSLAFVWPVNFPHKRPVAWKMFPFDDVIMFHKGSVLWKVLPWNFITMFHQHSHYSNTFVPVIGIWISIRYEWTFLLQVILPHIEHNLSISFWCDPSWHQLTIVSAFVLCILQPGDNFTNNI